MITHRLPKLDSIQELAQFWDTHDLTEFEDELEEVHDPVFERDTTIVVHLETVEAEAVKTIAQSRGLEDGALIREWVREKLAFSE